MTRTDLVELIAKRDGISEDEALSLVDECADTIAAILDANEDDPEILYYDAVDTLMDYLGLEPDYLDLVLEIE